MTQTVNHAGATYRTRWPKAMFSTYANVRVDREVWKADKTLVCPHCENRGLVALDGYSAEVVACPMCTMGRIHNTTWRVPIRYEKNGDPVLGAYVPADQWCWRPQDDIHQYSWNGGLSIDDTDRCSVCYEKPARPGGVCRSCKYRTEVNR